MSLPDRIIGALRRIIREELSGRVNGSGEVTAGAYLGQWEYTVAEATDTTVDVRAADSACPLPDIPKVPIFPGVAGVRYRPAVGSIVGIGFANGDPTKPRIIWADQTVPYTVTMDAAENPDPNDPSQTGLVEVGPTAPAIKLGLERETAGPAVHRVGDLGDGGTFAGTLSPLTYTAPNGDSWTIIGQVGMAAVSFTVQPVTGTPGKIVTKATEGSTKVSSG